MPLFISASIHFCKDVIASEVLGIVKSAWVYNSLAISWGGDWDSGSGSCDW